MKRRDALTFAATAFAACQTAGAQSSGRNASRRAPLISKDLPKLDGKDWNVTVVNVEYPPGGGSESHRHPAHVFVYVLEGALVTKLDDGETVTYTPGQMFYEQPMHLHTIARNASQTEPVKFLAFMLAEKGKPLTVPK